MDGDFFGKGEINTLVCVSFRFTYSLKVNVILLPVTLVLFNLGEALTRRGGMLSFGPPVGIPICAHPELLTAIQYKIEKIKRVNKKLIDLIN